jgi:hypothetical protein
MVKFIQYNVQRVDGDSIIRPTTVVDVKVGGKMCTYDTLGDNKVERVDVERDEIRIIQSDGLIVGYYR